MKPCCPYAFLFWQALLVRMSKHPSCFRLAKDLLGAWKEDEGRRVLISGSVADICPIAPNNVNTMAAAAIAGSTLGFTGVRGELVSDTAWVWFGLVWFCRFFRNQKFCMCCREADRWGTKGSVASGPRERRGPDMSPHSAHRMGWEGPLNDFAPGPAKAINGPDLLQHLREEARPNANHSISSFPLIAINA